MFLWPYKIKQNNLILAIQIQMEQRSYGYTRSRGTMFLWPMFLFNSIQFKKTTLIIPQGAILLWSWRARKIYIKLEKRREWLHTRSIEQCSYGHTRSNGE